MEQATSFMHGGESNTLDSMGLCLLSLDGGGVRGLSTLYILKAIISQLNHERPNHQQVKPCDVFDLIGGTSTGGLIAIMLGRLEMDVDECIAAYTKLMKTVFEKQSSQFAINWSGNINARFDTAKLESAIKDVVTSHGAKETDLFNDGAERGCRVIVCTAAQETKAITRLRSYSIPQKRDIRATICQAALATSAATTFFNPVYIGVRKFADGALGANNPVDEVEGEASDIWCLKTGNLKPLVKCFVSIGTGNPGNKAIDDKMWKFLSKTLVDLATQTEHTERKFVDKWRQHFDEGRYFRFNVDHGLQNVGLAEYCEQGAIEAATDSYLDHRSQVVRLRDCIQNLKLKQRLAPTDLSSIITEHNSPYQINHQLTPTPPQIATSSPPRPDLQEPLLHAVTSGNAGIAQLLLEKGAPLEREDSNGKTPLAHAATYGRAGVVHLLLEKGARVDHADKSGRTPLVIAIQMQHDEVARLLLEKGAHPDSKGKGGCIPLSYAAVSGNVDIAELLLEKGALLEREDSNGKTPLAHAATYGRAGIVHLLLEKGARVDHADKGGRTPLVIAIQMQHDEVARLLLG